MVAPTCPINKGQPLTNPRGTASTLLPSIPIATDLPSLIRAVNIIRDILRNITTSLTVNNVYMPQAPREPKVPGTKTYKFSPYPDWYQFGGEVKEGTIYYKSKSKKTRNKKMRAFIDRVDQIAYRNYGRDDDRLFRWIYRKRPDIDGHDNEPDARAFQEDFFERIVNVHWGKKQKPPQPPDEGHTDVTFNISFVGTVSWNQDPATQMTVTGKLAGGITDEQAANMLRQSIATFPDETITASGWTDYNQEFPHSTPIEPTGGLGGGRQATTVSPSLSGASFSVVDTVYGGGSGGSVTFGTVTVSYPGNTPPLVFEPYAILEIVGGSFGTGIQTVRLRMRGIHHAAPTEPPKPPEPTPPE